MGHIPPNNEANKANKHNPIPITKNNPPCIVKSVFVVRAYTVKAAVIPKVIKAAIKTKFGLEVTHAKDTM